MSHPAKRQHRGALAAPATRGFQFRPYRKTLGQQAWAMFEDATAAVACALVVATCLCGYVLLNPAPNPDARAAHSIYLVSGAR